MVVLVLAVALVSAGVSAIGAWLPAPLMRDHAMRLCRAGLMTALAFGLFSPLGILIGDIAAERFACHGAEAAAVVLGHDGADRGGTAQVTSNLLGCGVGPFAVGALSTAIGGNNSLRQGMALVCAATMVLAAVALCQAEPWHAQGSWPVAPPLAAT